jgi:LPXTG-motif cell wall-anchored protein
LASLIAAFALALPGAAFAQGAGDDQYQDPFGDGAGQRGTLTQAPRVSDAAGGSTSAPSRSRSTSGRTASGNAATGPGTAGGSGGARTSGSGSAARGQDGSSRAASSGAADAAGGGQLPHTGTDARLLVLLGAAFVLAGVGLRLRTIDPDAF